MNCMVIQFFNELSADGHTISGKSIRRGRRLRLSLAFCSFLSCSCGSEAKDRLTGCVGFEMDPASCPPEAATVGLGCKRIRDIRAMPKQRISVCCIAEIAL